MNSKERDQEYGIQPKNRELRREDLPALPAKIPRGYCKKLKGEHIYTLFEVRIYPYHEWQKREIRVTGYSRWKEYRCQACDKHKTVYDVVHLANPVKELAQL